MTDTLFDQNTDQSKIVPPAAPAGNTVQDINAYNDLLASIKNEQGEVKYKTVEDALKSVAHKEAFIKQILEEKRLAEEKIKAQEDLAKLLQKPAETPPASTQEVPVGLRPEDVLQILESREKAKVASANMQSVSTALAEAFGADSGKKLNELMQSTGMSKGLVDEMARNSPAALLKLLGVDKKAPAVPPTQSSSIRPPQTTPGDATKPKSVMKGGSNKTLVSEWKASAARTNEQLRKAGYIP